MTGRTLIVCASILVAGCNSPFRLPIEPSGSTPDDSQTMADAGTFTLKVEPANVTLTVANNVPVTQAYTVISTRSDGTTGDVTSLASWTLDDYSVGNFSGSSFTTSAKPGQTTVHAMVQGASATAQITVNFTIDRVIGSSTSMNVAQMFASATEDASLAPTVLYPTAATMFPPNIGDFEVHWQDSANDDLFQVQVSSPFMEMSLYTNEVPNAKSYAAFDPADWKIFGDAMRGGSFMVKVRGMKSSSPSNAGTSPLMNLKLSKNDIAGGIYYWSPGSSLSGTGTIPAGIFRHDFSDATSVAESYYDDSKSIIDDNQTVFNFNSGGSESQPLGCVGCHAISADGTQFSAVFQRGNTGNKEKWWGDVLATTIDDTMTTPDPSWGFSTFDPTGTLILTNSVNGAGTLTLRSSSTGVAITTLSTAGTVMQPEFSPTGDAIAYVQGTIAEYNLEAFESGGKILLQDYNASTKTFSNPRTLVTASGTNNNAYYPSWSPDGKWIIFDQAAGENYANKTAKLYIVAADGMSAPILLSAANTGVSPDPNDASDLTNSWPKFAPFVDADPAGNSVYWFTFSSKRLFGARATCSQDPTPCSQLWMAPFSPAAATQAADPSGPAFHLPFQNIETLNYAAQWTQKVLPFIN